MSGRNFAKGIYKGAAALVLTIAMIVSLSACGGGGESPASVSEPAEEQTAVSTSESSEAVPDEAESSEEEESPVSESSSEALETDSDDQPAETDSAERSGGQPEDGDSGASDDDAASAGEDPDFRDAVFNYQEAQGDAEAMVDLSSVGQGYVAIHCESESKLKFQVIKDDVTYTYSVVSGEDQVFPLQMGDGWYLFKVMKNIVDNKYTELYRCDADVTIEDPMDPFLRPNLYADYSRDSESVKLAASLAASAGTREDFIRDVYQYVVDHISYDQELAATVQSGYFPDPDRTLSTEKGICLDYACLTATMLRSQGVPTKVIFGYVAPDDIYHAWNKFYSENGGWQLVEFTVNANDWTRIDLTFYASSSSASAFIGDGTNYMEVYEY